MIDLHCHVLPGIDDGPETIDGSLALAAVAAQAGIRKLVATPHVSGHYPNTPDAIEGLVDELNARLTAEGITLEVVPGAEIAMAYVDNIDPAGLSRLRLGAGPWLLLEPPFTSVASGLDSILQNVERQGHRIILAHPERCPAFHRNPSTLESLVRGGVLTSITAGSLTGQFGTTVRRFTLDLLREGMVHNVASDAHDDLNRPPSVVAELDQAGLGPLTDWLTCAVPEAILSGEEIPPQPDVALPNFERARRQPWWRRRR
jgi:protein-tyrosine phosphatase